MTQIVDKKLKLMCDCCKSHFDKPCAWLSLGNEYCTEIMEIQKELEEKDKEIERLSKLKINRDKELLKLNDEIERLNNIINELEKDIEKYFKKEYLDRKLEDYNLKNCTYDYALVILGKLKELKNK